LADLQLGDELGFGEFGRVHEILSFQASSSLSGDEESESSWPSTSLIEAPVGNIPPTTTTVLVGVDIGDESPVTIGCPPASSTLLQHFGYFVDPSVSSLGEDDDNHDSDKEEGEELQHLRAGMIEDTRMLNGLPRFVLKCIREDLKDRKEYFATIDLACETQFLLALSHPNVIELRGLVGRIGRSRDFGLIMDRLSATLEDKMEEWRADPSSGSSDVVKHVEGRHGSTRVPHLLPKIILRVLTLSCIQGSPAPHHRTIQHDEDGLLPRFQAVNDIASGMRYLHCKRILFRDLKPENVGQTLQGRYVLFDFGLAKELKMVDLVREPDSYRATGLTGSRMYMAPEVAVCQPYGFKADVFSFAMLLWEIMALKDPYPHMTMIDHYANVILGTKRPSRLKHLLPKAVDEMMTRAWDADPKRRPTFESICDILETAIGCFGSSSSAIASRNCHDLCTVETEQSQ
jgi:hypothetical protein